MIEAVYHGDFTCKADVEKEFEEKLDGVNIIYAVYEMYYYEGEAFVLFEKDGKVYEVNGSHCSCYGLEGQWAPEEAVIDELKNRVGHGNMCVDNDVFKAVIESLQEGLNDTV